MPRTLTAAALLLVPTVALAATFVEARGWLMPVLRAWMPVTALTGAFLVVLLRAGRDGRELASAWRIGALASAVGCVLLSGAGAWGIWVVDEFPKPFLGVFVISALVALGLLAIVVDSGEKPKPR